MDNKYEYGKIMKTNDILNGEWINKQIKSMSKIYLYFDKITDKHENGIYIVKKLISNDKIPFQLGEDIAKFLYRTNITTLCEINNDEEVLITEDYINIIMNNCCEDMNKKCLTSIEVIFNHPTFTGIQNIDDILTCIQYIEFAN